jgi:hypothetical protein
MGKIAISKRKVIIDPNAPKVDRNGKSRVGYYLDWSATHTAGSLVYHTNDATDGHVFGFKWLKTESRLDEKNLYRLKMQPAAKTVLKNCIRDTETDYCSRYSTTLTDTANKKRKQYYKKLNGK